MDQPPHRSEAEQPRPEDGRQPEHQPAADSYEAPRLEHIGNLHELLGKSGPNWDFALQRLART